MSKLHDFQTDLLPKSALSSHSTLPLSLLGKMYNSPGQKLLLKLPMPGRKINRKSLCDVLLNLSICLQFLPSSFVYKAKNDLLDQWCDWVILTLGSLSISKALQWTLKNTLDKRCGHSEGRILKSEICLCNCTVKCVIAYIWEICWSCLGIDKDKVAIICDIPYCFLGVSWPQRGSQWETKGWCFSLINWKWHWNEYLDVW